MKRQIFKLRRISKHIMVKENLRNANSQITKAAESIRNDALKLQDICKQTSDNTKKLRALNETLLEFYRGRLKGMQVFNPDYAHEQVYELTIGITEGKLEKRYLLSVAMSVAYGPDEESEEYIADLIEMGEPAFVMKHKEQLAGCLQGLESRLGSVSNGIEKALNSSGLYDEDSKATSPSTVLGYVYADSETIREELRAKTQSLDDGEAADFVKDMVPIFFQIYGLKKRFDEVSSQLEPDKTMENLQRMFESTGRYLKMIINTLEHTNFKRYLLER